MSSQVKVAFASCADELTGPFLQRLETIRPDLPLWVVSEFPAPRGQWIPYHPGRSFAANLALCKAALGSRRIALAAIVLQPRIPLGRLRLLAMRLAPLQTLFFNENLDHFALRPRSLPSIGRHYAWRAKNWLRWQVNPGGAAYTWAWRLRHPSAMRRPLYYRAALLAGRIAARRRPMFTAPPPEKQFPRGVSVVIPTRNGRELLGRLLPGLLAGHPSEVIVVDNGSDDGTREWLESAYPAVRAIVHAAPLSFARAVNMGLDAVQFSRVLFLNNDMEIGPDCLPHLVNAFEAVPDLFCATAQIFFPPGERRQETGKAVMPAHSAIDAFPLACLEPIPGENYSYVLYGSGGCSMVDTAKALALGGFDEAFHPAYVEDLDLGFRAWQAGWPTVFVRDAQVVHRHRATTSRYFTSEQIERTVEVNYLKFLVRAVTGTETFARLWRQAIVRLNLQSVHGRRTALEALRAAAAAPRWVQRMPEPRFREELILGIGSGECAVWQGTAARRRPKVLVISPYVPFPLAHGGAVRMYNLMTRAARDFGQVLICFVDELETPPPELLEICCEIILVRRVGSHMRSETGRPDMVEEFYSAAFEAALIQTVRKWKPDIAQLEFTHMAQYAAACRPARTLLVEHDVTIDLYKQLLALEENWEVRRQLGCWERFERKAWTEVDCVIAMSEQDRKAVTGARCVQTIANGVDLQRFRPAEREPDPARLLFLGSFAHQPNLIALEFFLNEVWPLLASVQPTLHVIAGSRHLFHLEAQRSRLKLNLDQPGIELEGFVSDVRPAYERAAIVLAPLRASAGTNIKIMEAMAMGKAIVSTPAGINGLDLNSGMDLIVAPDAHAFAAAVLDLIAHPQKRAALEKQARRTAEVRYDWDAIAQAQAKLYNELRVSAP